MTLIKREPAQFFQLLSGVLAVLAPLAHLTPVQNGAVLALVTAAAGFATAAMVSAAQAAPLAAGLVKALLAVALAWRLNLSPDLQAGLMAFVEAGVAAWLRTQVYAQIPPVPPVPVTVHMPASGRHEVKES